MKFIRPAACAAIISALFVAVPAMAQEQPPPGPAGDPGVVQPDPAAPAVPVAPVEPAPAPAPKPKPKPKPKPLPPLPPAPTAKMAWIATLHSSVTVRVAPKPRARKRVVLSPTAPFAGGLTELLVTRSTYTGGVGWLEVLLPVRPNGSRGWIPADAVTTAPTPYRVEISVRKRRLALFRAGRRIMNVPVAVGMANTPTPLGRFAIAETVSTNDPGGFLGPLVLPITGYSKVLNEFAGGDGRVAVHGTSLPALIGTRASHGCVRMRNADIRRLARVATPGTPVLIRA